MKFFLRILAYAKPYSFFAILAVFFNILSVIFSLASVTLVIPVLGVLFGTQERVYEPATFTGSLESLEQAFNYQVTLIIENEGPARALAAICALIVGAYLGKNLFQYAAFYVTAILRNGTIRDIRNALHEKILALPMGFFSDQRKGDIMARMTSDMSEVEWTMFTSLQKVIRDPLTVIGSLIILVYMSSELTVVVGLMLPVTALVISVIGRSLKRKSTKAQNQLGFLLSLVDETVSGLRIIKAFNAEAEKHRQFRTTNTRYRHLMNRVLWRKDLSSPISEMLGVIVGAIVIWYGGSLILEGQGLKPEVFFGYLMVFFNVITPAKSVANISYNIQKGNASAQRIFEILDAENPIQDPVSPVALSEFTSAIEIENLSFRYGKDPVLSDINLTIAKGESVALVGPSGSGKTTLANLIPRYYEVVEGSLRLDGHPVADYSLRDLRAQLGIVTQESILFNDSVINNIRLGNIHASEEEVRTAAKVANAHEFIEHLPEGYYTNIGDGGGKLSGGQKQRISIARAVLKNPPILILDEATSALDTESEKLVQDALNRLMENRTSVVIAHRLSTVQHADKIVVMKDGRIEEIGTHDSLIASGGTYHKLTQMQSFV